MTKLHDDIILMGQRGKQAAIETAQLSIEDRNTVLLAFANAIQAKTDKILQVNAKDVTEYRQTLSLTMQKRLELTPIKIADMINSLRALAKLPDPLADRDEQWQAAAGFKIVKKIVPLGVVAMVYEARPNVTVDAAALAIKSGNAIILRGGKEAIRTNSFIADILRKALNQLNYSEDFIQLITDTSHDSVDELLHLRKYLDLLIPRGSGSFINHVVKNAAVPVIETGAGNDHIFVDQSADLEQAIKIILNSKVQNPSVCNSAEKLLIHAEIAHEFLPKLFSSLIEAGVEIRGDEKTIQIDHRAQAATDADWDTEYNDLIIAVKVVSGLDQAIDWISQHTTHHTEAILTKSAENTEKFMNNVDAAVVVENASTRFTDGFEFGFGAEIGISTQKLHARGPMGLSALTSYKYEIFGHGEVRK
ncbi:Gamma-glutamyl phosphate reductase {ECO:0000255/HAMAP-Rule:MF_00412} [Oenococcus sicerae]|nr:Gamma-glutamyl phosphate reductase {ECO:0000255/HAMAP-Rule:MF_00412} [Oenococcus sicerae]